MIAVKKEKDWPSNKENIRIPLSVSEEEKSTTSSESPTQTIEAVVSKYPTTTLVVGFAFGGLLGWLLKR